MDRALDHKVDKIWANYDLDDNGFLDRDEMRSFMINMLASMNMAENFNEESFRRLFDRFDVDGDGYVSRQEMRQFLERASTKVTLDR